MSSPALGSPASPRLSSVRAALRRIHLDMLDAVLDGGGVRRIAAIAADELHGRVAVVLPAAGVTAVEPPPSDPGTVVALRRYSAARAGGRPADVPPGLVHAVAIRSGDVHLGFVILLESEPLRHAPDVLKLAAVTALTAMTLEESDHAQHHRRPR